MGLLNAFGFNSTKLKSTTDIVNSSVSNVMSSMSSECGSNTSGSQAMILGNLHVSGAGSKLNAHQKIDITTMLSCQIQNDMSNQLKTQIANDIKKETELANSTPTIGFGNVSMMSADIATNVTNSVTNNINQNAVTKVLQDVKAGQLLQTGDVYIDSGGVADLSQDAVLKSTAIAIVKNSSDNSVISEFDNKIAEINKLKADSESYILYFIIFMVVVVGLACGYQFFSGFSCPPSSSHSSHHPPPPSTHHHHHAK